MTTARRYLALTALLLCLPPGRPASAQDELTGTLRGAAAEKVALAVPPTRTGPGADAARAAEISEVLRADLDFSGWFGLLDPSGEGRIPPERLAEPAAWRAAGAAYLVDTRLDEDGSRGTLTVLLLETGSGEALFHKRWYGSLPRDVRRLAHAAADAVVEALTGRPGIAQTRIAFVAKRGKAKEVYLMDYDGARVRRLTTTGTLNLSPAWSPDGRRLAFLSYIGRQPSIYLLDEDGRVTTLHPKGGELNAAPDFSPDGSQLAFSSDRDGNSEIYLYELATGREVRLTRHPAIDTAPCWSPSGRQIAFTSDRSGTPQIYVMNADGSAVRRVTWEGGYNESAAWSPDGGRLAFVSRIAGRFEIVIHDLATGAERIITSGPGNKENPRWAPDGRHLVFASDRDGEYAIYSIRDDGRGLRKLTRGERAETPDWSPVRR
ncbi:MAG: Tol-Pal system beta propeller repeat protein TolB [Acidobacteria bacterium]|nr:MAG: Tol-Pal system beta propeller repeat protein TolB [Acidobacteriota bacterium]